MNIHIEEKKGPRPDRYGEYYQYFFKMPNKEGIMTQYMIESSTNSYKEEPNYSVFEKQKSGEYLYINPTAQWLVDSLPFTLKEAENAVKSYETVQGLKGSAKDTWRDILNS